MTTPWQTTSAGSSPRSMSASPAATRAPCWAKDSPPGKPKSGRPSMKPAKPSGSSACTSVKKRSVQVARVGLHQSWLLARLQTQARCDDVSRFACAQEWAAPQRDEWDSIARAGRGTLGKISRLPASRVVKRDWQVALEAALQVVGGLTVAGQIDACTAHVRECPRHDSDTRLPLARLRACADTGTRIGRRRPRRRAAVRRTTPRHWPSGRPRAVARTRAMG